MSRVAFLIPDLGGGGAERVVLAQARDLARRGHQVDVLLAHAGGRLLPLLPENSRVFEFRCRRLAQVLFPLVRYLRRERPDTLSAVMWPMTVIAVAARALSRSRARLILSDHVVWSEHVRSAREKALLLATVRLLYPRANARIVVSARAADDLASLTGLRRSSIEVIHNPIEMGPTQPPDPAIETLWGDAEERILTVGTFKPEKNHSLLIRAFALLRESRPQAKLMIAGEGPLFAETSALIRELRLEGSVLLPGFFLETAPLYRAADLFVLSSNYEGFGNVLVEAMYAGIPIVSTDCVGGPREILADGRFGRLVPCGDVEGLAAALNRQLSEPADADALRRRAEQLSGAPIFERYAKIFVGDQH